MTVIVSVTMIVIMTAIAIATVAVTVTVMVIVTVTVMVTVLYRGEGTTRKTGQDYRHSNDYVRRSRNDADTSSAREQ